MTQRMVTWTLLEHPLALEHSTAAIEDSSLWALTGVCVKQMDSGLEKHHPVHVRSILIY